MMFYWLNWVWEQQGQHSGEGAAVPIERLGPLQDVAELLLAEDELMKLWPSTATRKQIAFNLLTGFPLLNWIKNLFSNLSGSKCL